MNRSLALLLLFAAGPLLAQTPTLTLASQWQALCASANPGSALALRCAEVAAAQGPGTSNRGSASAGQRLEEIPGQGRVATRDQNDSGFETELAAHLALFGSFDIGQVKRSAGPNEAAFNADNWSATVGLDWQPTPLWSLAFALQHAREDLDFRDSAGSLGTRFSGALLSASRQFGEHWLVSGYAGYLDGRYDLRRAINYELGLPGGTTAYSAVARARPDSRRRLFGMDIGRDWSRQGWNLNATLAADWSVTTIDAYQEAGGDGFALRIPGREVVTRRGRLDLSLSKALSMAWGIWQPSMGLGARREFANPRRAVTVRFVDAPATAITFDTEDPDRLWGEVSLGSAFTFAGGHAGFVEYRERIGHAFLKERLLALGWRLELP